MTNYLNLGNAREPEQRAVMERIIAAGVCPFCPENEALAELGQLVKTGPLWTLRENRWPYENTRLHLIAIANQHAERLSDLPRGSGEELLSLMQWVEKYYYLNSGGIGLRFGDPRFSGATVSHIHAHIIAIDKVDETDPAFREVKFKIGSGIKVEK